MSEPLDDHTPSILAGLGRFWWPITLILAVAGLLGAAYAASTFQASVGMSVGVEVATSGTGGSGDANRTTAEIAAALRSPTVVSRAEEQAGVEARSVFAATGAGNSVIRVSIVGETLADAAALGEALVPAYEAVQAEQREALAAEARARADLALEPLVAQRDLLAGQLAGASTQSAAFSQLSVQYQAIEGQITRLQQTRDDALVRITSPAFTVYTVDAPAAGSSLFSHVARFVPAAMIAAFVLALLGLSVLIRRSPWLVDASDAAAILGTRVLAVGTGGRLGDTEGRSAEVVATALEHSVRSTDVVNVALVPVGNTVGGYRPGGRPPAKVAERARQFSLDLAKALDRRGKKVVIAQVAAGGPTEIVGPLGEPLRPKSPVGGREWVPQGVDEAVSSNGLDPDIVIVVSDPAEPCERLDLLGVDGASVLVVLSGTPLAALVEVRRELDAGSLRPVGIVLDP